MPDLPKGTVAFLFTDIEGSTRLLGAYPEHYPAALARHDTLLRAAIEAHHGVVFETVGDAFYAAFSRPTDAVAAALQAQLALSTEDWGRLGTLKARMGLHAGEVEVRGEHYFGPALYRCARLMAIGHGGQTLLSSATAEIVRDSLPPEAGLRELGLHRLKDLPQPETVYQLVHPSLQTDFPALRSVEGLPNNLPVQLTSFVGREKELVEIKRLLGTTRLLTLLGPGGAGKTRLALQAATEGLVSYPDGTWWVELAPLVDPALVAQAVAGALSVREKPDRPLIATLREHVRSKHLLLVLDNCEHLIGACAELASELLRAGPQVRLLATSREALSIPGETTWRVPSLSLPDPNSIVRAQLARSDAGRLFLDRVSAVRSDFVLTDQNAIAIAQVCQRLDGIPLALELAAARVKLLSVEQIAARLDDRFRLLSGGSRTLAPRQQTLRAAIDWSYQLLAEPEQRLFERVAVFAGGWSLEAAEAVCAGDGIDELEVLDLLGQLVDKSLVLADEREGAVRYRMLETLREYGRESLAGRGGAPAVQRAHATYFLELVESAGPELWTSDMSGIIERLEREHDNVRLALRWLIDQRDSATAQQLGAAMGRFWYSAGYVGEGRAWLAEALALPGGDQPTRARARALIEAGSLANAQGDNAAARPHLEEALVLARELGDDLIRALALRWLSHAAVESLDYAKARALGKEGVAASRAAGHRAAEAFNLFVLAQADMETGDFAAARRLAKESLGVSLAADYVIGAALALTTLGRIYFEEGDLVRARAKLEEAMARYSISDAPLGRMWTECSLGWVALDQGDLARARALFTEILMFARQVLGGQARLATALEGLAQVAATDGQPERAVRLAGAAERLRADGALPRGRVEGARLEGGLALARAALSTEAADAAWSAGFALSTEEAIDEGLAAGEPPTGVTAFTPGTQFGHGGGRRVSA